MTMLDFTTPSSGRHSTAALHHLLITHPEIAEMPIGWSISIDGTIWPELPLRAPGTDRMMAVLAAALELEVNEHDYRRSDGRPSRSLHAEGRWAGATWHLSAYLDRDGEPVR